MSEFSFSATPYQGFEDEVLRIRNRNRSVPQDRLYLDWRYVGQKTRTPPEILWVKTSSGDLAGMAAFIYRPYWIDNKQYEFMILGDISLDKEYRGTGLADKFFHYIKRHIGSKTNPCALVIPNIPARKVLNRCGWKEREQLVHHVLLLNPEKKIRSILKFKICSNIIGKGYLFLLTARLKTIQTKGLLFNIVTEFGEEFDLFWNTFDKKNICLRDRSRKSLQWRYGDRPGEESFFIVTAHLGGDLVAYIVYSMNNELGSSNVYELMAIDKKYLNGLIKWFINYLQAYFHLDSIRIALNWEHPYSTHLRKIGFSPRKGGQSIQILVPEHPEASLGAHRCLLTAGDKDV